MQAVFDYLDGLALLDFIVVGAVLLMGVYLALPDLAASWRRRRLRRRSEAFRAAHGRPALGESPPSLPVGSPARVATRRDLPKRGAANGSLTDPAGAAQTSLHRPRSDFDAHMPTRNERGRRR